MTEVVSTYHTAAGGLATMRRPSFLVLLATGGALFVMAAFFTNVLGYLAFIERNPIPLIAWDLSVVALGLVCCLQADGIRIVFRTPIAAWSLGFATIVVVSMLLWSSGSDITLDVTRQRVGAVAKMVAFAILFAPAYARRAARWALVPLTLAILPIEIYDLLHPFALSNNIGRAAGLYINPNVCGEALTIGMLFGHEMLKPRWRPLFIAIVGGGVVLTLSRGAILIYGLIVGILAVQRRVSARGIAGLGIVTLVGVLLGLQFTGRLDTAINVAKAVSAASDRVVNVQNVAGGGDASASDRLLLAGAAVQMFEDNPLLGKGTGATSEWEYSQGPHNMYLLFAAEYGVLGLLLYPSLVLVICWRARGPDRTLVWPIGVFFLFQGLFSHNVVDNWPDLVGIAMAVSMLHPPPEVAREPRAARAVPTS